MTMNSLYLRFNLAKNGIFAALILTLCAFALPAHAEDLQGEGRYSMSATDNGFVRLDKVTGAMTFCKETDGSLVCKLAADERQALNDKIEALENQVSKLQNQSGKTYGLPLEDKNLGPVENDKSWAEKEAEMEKALSFGEKMIRRFFKLFKDLEAEEKTTTENNT